MNTYAVQFEQDPETNWWVTTVREEPAIVSQGKTLAEAFARAREAIESLQEHESRRTGPIVLMGGETIWSNRSDLTKGELGLLKKQGDMRVRALETGAELERQTYECVKLLNVEKNLSYRYVGKVLGITHQRVEQIAKPIRARSKVSSEATSAQTSPAAAKAGVGER